MTTSPSLSAARDQLEQARELIGSIQTPANSPAVAKALAQLESALDEATSHIEDAERALAQRIEELSAAVVGSTNRHF